MKRVRVSSLSACSIITVIMLCAAGLSGCSGCSGCSKEGKEGTGGILGSLTDSRGTMTVTVYAYCPCARCNTAQWKGRVSTGQKMKKLLAEGKNICAADPDVLPLGTIVTYNGKDYVVADTGSNIKGNTINILLGSHRGVNAFGVKKDQTISYKK